MGIRKGVTSAIPHACLSLRCIAISFYHLLLLVIYVSSLDGHGVQLMYASFSSMHCSSAEALYVCQTVSSRIRKRLPNWVVTKRVSLLCVMICLSRPSPCTPECTLAWSRRSGLSKLRESREREGGSACGPV